MASEVVSGAVPSCCETMKRTRAVRWWTRADWLAAACRVDVQRGSWRIVCGEPGPDDDHDFEPCLFCPFCGAKLGAP